MTQPLARDLASALKHIIERLAAPESPVVAELREARTLGAALCVVERDSVVVCHTSAGDMDTFARMHYMKDARFDALHFKVEPERTSEGMMEICPDVRGAVDMRGDLVVAVRGLPRDLCRIVVVLILYAAKRFKDFGEAMDCLGDNRYIDGRLLCHGQILSLLDGH